MMKTKKEKYKYSKKYFVRLLNSTPRRDPTLQHLYGNGFKDVCATVFCRCRHFLARGSCCVSRAYHQVSQAVRGWGVELVCACGEINCSPSPPDVWLFANANSTTRRDPTFILIRLDLPWKYTPLGCEPPVSKIHMPWKKIHRHCT